MSIDPFEAGSACRKELRPLSKHTLAGRPYVRDPRIEAKLHEALALPPPKLVERCSIQERKEVDYVPSECLVYLVRTWAPDDPCFGDLYKALIARVVPRLPDGRAREKLLDRFVDLLALDRTVYTEKLDFYEVRFDAALLRLCSDAIREARRESHYVPIEIDPETGELGSEVEKAIDHYNPFDSAALDREDYRSRLDEAINSLPDEQRRIMQLMRQDMPIDSKIPGTMTIAKELGKAEKTIRMHRDQAFSKLRSILEKE